jgi:hypothetical protein
MVKAPDCLQRPVIRSCALAALLSALSFVPASAYELRAHPRIFMAPNGTQILAARAAGPLRSTYEEIKAVADRAVATGVQQTRRGSDPLELLSLGICHMVERAAGRDAKTYADAVKKFWGDGAVLTREADGPFGYYAMVYDWIYDSLSPAERTRYGNALGEWLRWYTDTPEITLKSGAWWYNQTWGPAHLGTRNTRDGIAPKLFAALAIAGAGTEHEGDARRFLDSWATRVPKECIPAFDQMGGVWSESMGHGNYGPVAVIPWAFEAWRTATGEDLFAASGPAGYTREMTSWAVHLKMPWTHQTAWIDDNSGVTLSGFARVSPILAARYSDGVAAWIDAVAPRAPQGRGAWTRFLFTDPSIEAVPPSAAGYAAAKHFTGAGHVYLRSAWQDPNATWAFFGAGDRFGAHARDDEGHFLIAKKGLLVGRAGGTGHNDRDYYTGGSLAFNVVTIFDPEEEFRRTVPSKRALDEGGTKNERDGGMIRWVYSGHQYVDRADITQFSHDSRMTYVAADLTKAYRPQKVREITRQFVYIPGNRDLFLIFDRVDAVRSEFAKTWFLHVPAKPQAEGEVTTLVDGHLWRTGAGTLTWLSDPAGVKELLSTGRSRAFLKTVLPEKAEVTIRGGDGHDFWGHPLEPTAQYNHKHQGREGDAAPVVPWRIEVTPSGQANRQYFLHVMEIAGENAERMSDVQLQRPAGSGKFGITIARPEGKMSLWFTQVGKPSIERTE